MKKTTLGLIAALFLMTSTASAKNVWRECGIGGMIFKKTAWAAIVSNIIWDLGTTATSSNVSSDDLCEGPTASTANFIHETYAVLEEEVALGQGEHLAAMMNMMGCDESNQAALTQNLRTELQTLMAQPNYSERTNSENAEQFFYSTMDQAKALNCSAI